MSDSGSREFDHAGRVRGKEYRCSGQLIFASGELIQVVVQQFELINPATGKRSTFTDFHKQQAIKDVKAKYG